ncbi:MAG: sigma-70 family RNA polymerase sigma factor [Chloroflexota bacterium]|nr:sigma-70 family RNA polymerase sigma factor [Chloroflexota bacterium]
MALQNTLSVFVPRAFARIDRVTFAEAVQQHQDELYGVALRILGDRDPALDATSRALLKALRSWHRYDQTRPVRHWLLRIVANEAISIGRERTRDRARSASADDALSMRDQAPLPDEHAVSREERARVRRAVADLPELYRVPVVLRYFSELSVEEIASITGRPASTLGVQLLRARALLRTALEATR